MTVRVKICGLTTPEQAASVAEMGVDALGLVFVPQSARHLTPKIAEEVIRAIPPLVSVVGLFLDAPRSMVAKILDRVPLDVLQFHGSETPDYCRSFGRPYIKAIAMGDHPNLASASRGYADARGLLLDAHRAGELGGTGQQFDWSVIRGEVARPVILAGGLNPDNVGDAISRVRPAAVDASSGVESSPGVKDLDQVRHFLAEVQSASIS